MLHVEPKGDRICFGDRFSLNFQRTLRIPDDGREYPLPPGLGCFPVFRVSDYSSRVPASLLETGGVFIPMYQREALWLNFDGAYWKPNAVKVGVGHIDAISGKRLHRRLNRTKQNYLVCPDQPWLDGINAGMGFIRQFVAMPLGMGYTVEAQITGKEDFGGVQITVYDPKPGIFPEEPPGGHRVSVLYEMGAEYSAGTQMGIGAGGKMQQKIYPDEYGVDTWDLENYGRVDVHIVNSMMFREITGFEPPSTPVSASMYTEYGLPWFDLYDEDKADLNPSDDLAKVKTVKEMDKEKGFEGQQDDAGVDVADDQVKKLMLGSSEKSI